MRIVAFFAGMLAILALAQAAPITFGFTGVVTQVPLDDVFGDILAGAPLQGTFVFDSGAADLIPGTETGSYTSSGTPFGMTVTIAGHAFDAGGFTNIGIFNGVVDQYTVLAQSAASNLTLELFLQDNTGGAFAGDSLPLTPPPLPLFAIKDFHLIQSSASGELQVDGQVETLTCVAGCDVPAPIPEPSSWMLLLAGAAVLAALRMQQR